MAESPVSTQPTSVPPAVLRDCIQAATAAPSVHNTQPWLFRLRGAGLEVIVDPRRRLSTVDPQGREMYVSVGAAVFNLRVALAARGWQEHTTLLPDPATPLLYVLRNDLGLQGPKFGCGLGQCGACTVIINGGAVRSCVMPTSSVKTEVTTLEGLATNGKLHPLQQAWIDEQVPQCGFCQNGQILTAKAMLDKNPHPTDAQIRETMNGTLCRCMSYYRVQTAVKRAAKTLADAAPASTKEVVA